MEAEPSRYKAAHVLRASAKRTIHLLRVALVVPAVLPQRHAEDPPKHRPERTLGGVPDGGGNRRQREGALLAYHTRGTDHAPLREMIKRRVSHQGTEERADAARHMATWRASAGTVQAHPGGRHGRETIRRQRTLGEHTVVSLTIAAKERWLPDRNRENIAHVPYFLRCTGNVISSSLQGLDRGEAAVRRDDRARDVARARRGQKGDDFGDLLGGREALNGCGPPELLDNLLDDRSSGVLRTRGNGVHPDSACAELRGPRETDFAGHAADVDDPRQQRAALRPHRAQGVLINTLVDSPPA